VPQVNRARIIGYLPNGRPVREIRGGSEAAPEGQQQDGQGDVGDLLGGDPGDQGGQGDQAGGDPAGGEAPPAWWTQASAAMQAQFTSEIDRRINQLAQRQRQQQPGQQPDGQGQQQQAAAVDVNDLRYARTVFRETLGDTIRLSPEEREFVNGVVGGVVRDSLQRTGDPDQAGAEAASTIAGNVKKLRAAHQREILRQLDARGALDMTKVRGQENTPGQARQQPAGRGQASDAQQWAAGASRAQDIAARRGRAVPDDKTN
jgi:hypothetical protein